MRCEVLRTAQRFGMLQSGSVLLALSGGADSMSLLHVLLSLREELGFTLEAAHVNHSLRGAESDEDEAFVRKMCAQWNVPLHVLHADVKSEAAKSGEGLEACGRRIRYAFFDTLPCGEIATAHTADDNAETVLLHLVRGSGLAGLCGIAPRRGKLVRPLLYCSREQVEAYCQEHDIPFVTDSTNLSDDYTRNRVRHLIIPPLREINPAVTDAITRCAETLRAENDFLDSETDALLAGAAVPFGYKAAALLKAHPALRERAVQKILSEAMWAFPQKHHVQLVSALLETGGSVQTEQNVTVCVYGGILYLDKPLRPAWTAPVENGEAALPFGSAKIQILDAKNIQNVHKRDLANCLCCDTIHSSLFFRSRMPGDCMTRANSLCRKPMKQLLSELGVPAPYRMDVPVLTDGERILWAEGVGCDAAFAVTDASEHVMRIQIIREDVQ